MPVRPRIAPQRWTPMPAPEGRPPTPVRLDRVLRVPGVGPEDTLVRDGAVFTGVDDGRILRLTSDGRRIDVVADTGGRPLGLENHPDGGVVVCDAQRGLLRFDPATGDVAPLAARGEAGLRVCNNAAVAADGTIYFTDSTQRFELAHWTADLLEHSGTGRLLRRGPDGAIDVLADGLQFANGVALAADASFVVVAETGSYTLTRVWLTGPNAGRSEPFGDVLPAFPDNLSTGPDGLIWVALASPRKALLDRVAGLPWARRAVWALPEAVHPKPASTIRVRALAADGTIVHDLLGRDDRFGMVTGVRRHGDELYLGSLTSDCVAVLRLP